MGRKERYGFSVQCLSVLSEDTCGTLSAWSLSWTPVPTCILLSEPKQVRVKRILPVQLRGRKKAQKSGIQPTAHLHRHYSFIDDLFLKVLFSFFVAGL